MFGISYNFPGGIIIDLFITVIDARCREETETKETERGKKKSFRANVFGACFSNFV